MKTSKSSKNEKLAANIEKLMTVHSKRANLAVSNPDGTVKANRSDEDTRTNLLNEGYRLGLNKARKLVLNLASLKELMDE